VLSHQASPTPTSPRRTCHTTSGSLERLRHHPRRAASPTADALATIQNTFSVTSNLCWLASQSSYSVSLLSARRRIHLPRVSRVSYCTLSRFLLSASGVGLVSLHSDLPRRHIAEIAIASPRRTRGDIPALFNVNPLTIAYQCQGTPASPGTTASPALPARPGTPTAAIKMGTAPRCQSLCEQPSGTLTTKLTPKT